MTEKKKPTIDEQLKTLEEILKELESEDITLEASLKAFEKGVKCVRETRAMLEDAEKQLKLLTEGDPDDDF
jgi:exodeoxyribonuclease VII small subunit